MKKDNKNHMMNIMIIPIPGEKPDENGVFVSVNEKSCMIKPGEVVAVDESIYNALMSSRYADLVVFR